MFCKELFLSLFFFSISTINIMSGSDWEGDAGIINDVDQKPLFVSLGSHCEPNHMIRNCDLRRTAFPFDWIIILNGKTLLEILDQNFLHFLNENNFRIHDGGPLLHDRYELEFLHEGDWRGEGYAKNIQKFKDKYTRRINRFRELNNYQGKVFFLRAAYLYSLTDHRSYKNKENLEITKEYAQALYDELKRFFPTLNFSLIILNLHEKQQIIEEPALSENIRFFRASPNVELTEKTEDYKKFFAKLSQDQAAKIS